MMGPHTLLDNLEISHLARAKTRDWRDWRERDDRKAYG